MCVLQIMERICSDTIGHVNQWLNANESFSLSRSCWRHYHYFLCSRGWTHFSIGQDIHFSIPLDQTNSVHGWRPARIESIRVNGHKYCVGVCDTYSRKKYTIESTNVTHLLESITTKAPNGHLLMMTSDDKTFCQVRDRSPILSDPPFIGQRVDVLDGDLTWWEARIIQIYEKTNEVRVHYDLWTSRWDEDIWLDSGRIAPFRSYTDDWRSDLEEGDDIEFQMRNQKWVSASIVSRTDHDLRICYSQHYYETLPIDSVLIAPMGVHVHPRNYRYRMSVFRCEPRILLSNVKTIPLMIRVHIPMEIRV